MGSCLGTLAFCKHDKVVNKQNLNGADDKKLVLDRFKMEVFHFN